MLLTRCFAPRDRDTLHASLVGEVGVQRDAHWVNWLHMWPVQAVSDQISVSVLSHEAGLLVLVVLDGLLLPSAERADS